MLKPLLTLSFSLVLFSQSLVLAADPAPSSSWSSKVDPKVGWYWYEVEPLEEDLEEEERVLPKLSNYPLKKLWDMHPDDFQKLISEFHKKAVMTLKEDDVRDYLTIQDVARRKAFAYTNVSVFTVQKNPILSLEGDYPTVIPGKNAKLRLEKREVKLTIDRSIREFALIYFYSPTCHFCEEQNNILKLFQSRHPWAIKKINILKHPKLAEKMGVHAVPYLVLLSKKSKDIMPIAAGVISVKELEKRLHRGIRHLNNETDASSYSMYEFQRGGGFDATAPLHTRNNRPLDDGGLK